MSIRERLRADELTSPAAARRSPAVDNQLRQQRCPARIPNGSMAAVAAAAAPVVHRMASRSQGAGPLDPTIANDIQGSIGKGDRLPSQTQAEMETFFDTDLSPVRVHTDSEADRLSRSVQAKAFTTGTDVFFRQGVFDTGSNAGRRLLAHELTHVTQPEPASPSSGGYVSDPSDHLERQADQVADDFVATRHEPIRSAVLPAQLGQVQRMAGNTAATAVVQRACCDQCEDDPSGGCTGDDNIMVSRTPEDGSDRDVPSGEAETPAQGDTDHAESTETAGVGEADPSAAGTDGEGGAAPETEGSTEAIGGEAVEVGDAEEAAETAEAEDTGGGEAPGAPGAVTCGPLPNPTGEWATENWLCNMRRSMSGDDSYLLAAAGQRGAPGSAKGRSVALVHQVLRNWMCRNPVPSTGLTPPTGNTYTSASIAATRAFQGEWGIATDGVVGPDTIRALDFEINGAPVPVPPTCTGHHLVCPERDPTEAADSHGGSLEIDIDKVARGELIHLKGFGVDDDSLSKLEDKDLTKIEEMLDPARDIPVSVGTTLLCTRPGDAQVYGFKDCHEPVGLAGNRARRVKDQFADSNLEVRTMAPGGNADAEERRKNRAITIVIPHVIDREVDLTDEFDGLMYLFGHERTSLLGTWDKHVIGLADQLALSPTGYADEFLGRANATKVGIAEYPSGCDDYMSWPWESATSHVLSRLRYTLSPHICTHRQLVLDDLQDAVNSLLRDMQQGIGRLLYWGAWAATASESAGCGCVGAKEVWDRTLDPESVYYALRDHEDFVSPSFMGSGMWERHQSCVS